MANIRDITSQRFGRLVALERTDQKDKWGRCFLWRCRCDCGGEKLVPTSMLTSGMTRSCGCMVSVDQRVDIAGGHYGRLVAIRDTGRSRNHSAVWECVCDCGRTCTATVDALRQGNKMSCGCLARETKAAQAARAREKNIRIEGTCINQIRSRTEYSNNSSGRRGVSWHKGQGKWQARIQFRGRMYSLGYYRDFEDAVRARERAEQMMYDDFIARYEAGEFGAPE